MLQILLTWVSFELNYSFVGLILQTHLRLRFSVTESSKENCCFCFFKKCCPAWKKYLLAEHPVSRATRHKLGVYFIQYEGSL